MSTTHNPSLIVSVEDNFRDQPARRATGLAAKKLPGLAPFLSPGPADDAWFLSRDPASISRPGSQILKPRDCEKLDCGVSLAVVMGEDAFRLDPADAMQAVAGVTIALDVVRHDLPEGQGSLARSYATHTPLGDTVVPLAAVGDLANASMSLWVNDKRIQNSSVSEMIASPAALLAAITRRVPLRRGDIVLTGTPGGVFADSGGPWLAAGDKVRAEIASVGEIAMEIADGDGDPLSVSAEVNPKDPTRVFATGSNYGSHLAEMGASAPPAPSGFFKFRGSVTGEGEITLPADSKAIDYEGEIAVVIGRAAHRVSVDDALDHVAGFMVSNDVSARDLPMSHIPLAKASPGFTPLGPFVPLSEVDPGDIGYEVTVNGDLRQSAHSSDMVNDFAHIIASFSQGLPLLPGDVILTGTPGGVGVGRKPPEFLADGDEVVVTSPQLGELKNRFVAE